MGQVVQEAIVSHQISQKSHPEDEVRHAGLILHRLRNIRSHRRMTPGHVSHHNGLIYVPSLREELITDWIAHHKKTAAKKLPYVESKELVFRQLAIRLERLYTPTNGLGRIRPTVPKVQVREALTAFLLDPHDGRWIRSLRDRARSAPDPVSHRARMEEFLRQYLNQAKYRHLDREAIVAAWRMTDFAEREALGIKPVTTTPGERLLNRISSVFNKRTVVTGRI